MDSPSRELALLINGHMADQGAPLDDSQMAAFELALESLKPRRRLLEQHPLSPDSDPYQYEITLEYRYDETPEERAAREAKMERRLAVLMWKPEDGPPPKGVGFTRLSEQTIWWAPKNGEPIKIADMADSHRRNLIGYLERGAETLKSKAYTSLMLTMPADPSDGVASAFDGMLGEMEHATALDWLNDQPLVKELRKLDKKARKNERANA